MARYTDRFGLSILGPGDTLQADGFKFTDADRRLIDRLLQIAAEGHHHTGSVGVDNTPVAAPSVHVSASGGAIPSGVRYYYRFTVVDENDNESAPSPVAPATMPFPLNTPSAPTLSVAAGSGDLGPGSYSYVLSAYSSANTLETKATNSSFVTVPGSNPHNHVTLMLPNLPIGASGFNVYRKSPSGMHYLWLLAIPAPLPLATWVDDGTVEGDCDRSLPSTNRTSNTNKVTVTFPGATPTVPDGLRWRIYRTADPNRWGSSFLVEIVPIGATPTTPTSYDDIGSATRIGGPPTRAQVVSSPPKVILTDGAEVEGSLPPGLNVIPTQISFALPGPVTVAPGSFIWVCDFDQADILSVRAFLGVGSEPASTDVEVDVRVLRPAMEGAWTSIYPTAPRPTVPVGQTIGDPAEPDLHHLVLGDGLVVDVTQAGGGATPTDVDLTVNVLLFAQAGSTVSSYPWVP